MEKFGLDYAIIKELVEQLYINVPNQAGQIVQIAELYFSPECSTHL